MNMRAYLLFLTHRQQQITLKLMREIIVGHTNISLAQGNEPKTYSYMWQFGLVTVRPLRHLKNNEEKKMKEKEIQLYKYFL